MMRVASDFDYDHNVYVTIIFILLNQFRHL